MFLDKIFDMSGVSSQTIYCPNLACPNPRNALGRLECEACQTSLIYKYLWAVGLGTDLVPKGREIGDRYLVISPQVWLDTKPGEHPTVPDELPDAIAPYLHLFPEMLHVPQVYGFCQLGDSQASENILLLENVPLDAIGQLHPSIVEVWPGTLPVRQVYWLWQILQLWAPLLAEGVASSLLTPDNIRVEGWRVRLLELMPDDKVKPTLRNLGEILQPWAQAAQPSIQQELQGICKLLDRSGINIDAIAAELNQLLLEVAASLPLNLEIAGASDPGPQRDNNEDTCYPITTNLSENKTSGIDPKIPYLAIVCDGVGGHEGGEIASQLAVQSLKPLIQTLITEISQQPELTPPKLVSNQLEEIVRVVNNVIAVQNNEQGRELRERMGTTLVMAIQLPQKVNNSAVEKLDNSHELYLVNVGDSRAYWLTTYGCCRLTVDDDVASRQVRLGHCLYWEGQRRIDGGALTQALGTRDAEYLHPTIQRFIVEEDGLLLLCSDGLSDNDLVEKCWANYAPAVLKGEISLQAGVNGLIRQANEENGHDNTSVVLLHCRVSNEKLVLFNPIQLPNTNSPLESELSEASKALLYAETVAVKKTDYRKIFNRLLPIVGALALIFVVGFGAMWYYHRQAAEQKRQEIPLFPNNPDAPK
ncbi:serine/threonine protein phosphatase [Oscillatoriales cyanobacterium USR001]|nr:serine/threonine protein phosphatase [Oscillatoriales cyanobacterium USR001]